jgi:copper chaperone CopZ
VEGQEHRDISQLRLGVVTCQHHFSLPSFTRYLSPVHLDDVLPPVLLAPPPQEALVAAVEDAGFDGKLLSRDGGLERVMLKVGGMTCGACSSAVEGALKGVPGVSRAAVNLLGGSAEVWFDGNTTGVCVHVFGAGYGPRDRCVWCISWGLHDQGCRCQLMDGE